MIKEKKKYRSRLRTPVKILKIILILYRTGGFGGSICPHAEISGKMFENKLSDRKN